MYPSLENSTTGNAILWLLTFNSLVVIKNHPMTTFFVLNDKAFTKLKSFFTQSSYLMILLILLCLLNLVGSSVISYSRKYYYYLFNMEEHFSYSSFFFFYHIRTPITKRTWKLFYAANSWWRIHLWWIRWWLQFSHLQTYLLLWHLQLVYPQSRTESCKIWYCSHSSAWYILCLVIM